MTDQLDLFGEIKPIKNSKGIEPFVKYIEEIKDVISEVSGMCRRLNCIYQEDRYHILCCCKRKSMDCPNGYSKQCSNYIELWKTTNMDDYYYWKRKCRDEEDYKQFKKLFNE